MTWQTCLATGDALHSQTALTGPLSALESSTKSNS